MTDQNLSVTGRAAEAGPFSGLADVGASSLPDVPAEAAGHRTTAFVQGAVPVTIRAVSHSSGGVVATDVDVTADLLTKTYQTHYTSLLRLAALLLDDLGSCEDVVQEAFIRVHAARARVREPDKLLAYLRQTVVNLSRSTLRRRLIGLRLLPKPLPDAASAEEGAYDALERDALIQALRGLQRRQREVLVLRYYADLTEAQVATALGVSVGAVKAYGSRGIEALRARMEEHR
ncbi:SigE family RNA polymerase sigma factor [Actinocrinis sp.]|uniref:SigE family RNA polymerase sigma factor n=1 Tax=Actinocrinis sp. TaxID=1920516 RepID=UPI002DDD8A8C|nr:SigE family RNA polymerase sigma factor [Actinocrinis sp.]